VVDLGGALKRDVAIVGGGFFGARIAIELARSGRDVVLLEREAQLLQRASLINQARVHGGYHYPRSILTALRSRVNLPVFAREYDDCIDRSFEKYYAIASRFSKVSDQQFRLFCERVGAPVKPAPDRVQELFDDNLIDTVFAVEEYAFDSAKLRARLTRELAEAGVECLTGAYAERVRPIAGGLRVEYTQAGQERELVAGQVLNATYAHINQLNRASGIAELPLKHEIAEVALIEPPEELEGRGVTVMCGPFFSTMPYPPRGLYSFTHVRYTPHTEWHEGPGQVSADSYAKLTNLQPHSAYPKMLADAARYLPCMTRARHVDSLYEVKTVLPQSEGDDSRPILYKQDHGLPGYTCIMGAKLDNIYDVLKELVRT
jgi:glycine/D-amino acid oxidase-like deaminating enzyme